MLDVSGGVTYADSLETRVSLKYHVYMLGGVDIALQLNVTLSPAFARVGPITFAISGPAKHMKNTSNHFHLKTCSHDSTDIQLIQNWLCEPDVINLLDVETLANIKFKPVLLQFLNTYS